MAGEITYRLANELDVDNINAFYNTIYKKQRTREQFIWEYFSSPAGKPLYQLVEIDGEIIGTVCAIPFTIITHNNTELLSAKLEDVLVSPNHRGKHIFENMYRELLVACKNKKFDFVWGFAYLDKHYTKIGFEIPYKTTMGYLTISPTKAIDYFYKLTAKKNISSYFKIVALSYFSYFKYKLLQTKKQNQLILDSDKADYNTDEFNYICQPELFGLKLDRHFIDYRIDRNPYSSNYKTVNYKENGVLKASIVFNITKENIGFIVHLSIDENLSADKKMAFIAQVVKQSALKNTNLIRFWGFEQNAQNLQEVTLLKKCNFVFLKRGISFVGLKLNTELKIKFSDFVLSRMASQGTD